MEITLLELNLEEPSFRANAPFSNPGSEGEDEESSTSVDFGSASDDESSGPGAKGFVVGLLFLVGVGLAVRRFMGGDSAAQEETADAGPITA